MNEDVLMFPGDDLQVLNGEVWVDARHIGALKGADGRIKEYLYAAGYRDGNERVWYYRPNTAHHFRRKPKTHRVYVRASRDPVLTFNTQPNSARSGCSRERASTIAGKWVELTEGEIEE